MVDSTFERGGNLVSPPCYSVRLVAPFVRYLQRHPGIPADLLEPLAALDPDERLPIASVHELLVGAVHLTGDQDLGLKAAREMELGDYGTVEYAALSAATFRDSCITIGRYMRLVNDALRVTVVDDGVRGVIQFENSVTLPRPAADFQSAAFHISGSHAWPPGFVPRYEVWFTHARPYDITEYERTFVGGELHFLSPMNALAFPREYLAERPRIADPKLHAIIRQHAEAMLAEMPRALTLTERVRDALTSEIATRVPTLAQVAKDLSMGERTLSRHLEEEGITFKELLDDVRRRLALRYLRKSDIPISEIAFLLGYSQAAAFHRAFRRWTRQTPIEYRKHLVLSPRN